MKLNEFTTQELEILADTLQSKIDINRKLLDSHKIDGLRNRYQKDIDTFELMRVKVNNALGKFGKTYKVGSIFKIDGKEHHLRLINGYGGCWLEPVLSRNNSQCITGGKNFLCGIEDLEKYELVDVY